MKRISLLCIFAAACTVHAPAAAPAAPVTPAPAPVATPVTTGSGSGSAELPNLAQSFADSWIPVMLPGMSCSPWTGRGTKYDGVDSVKCTRPGGTVSLYCAAPVNAKPSCDIAADWTPKQKDEAPKAPAPAKK